MSAASPARKRKSPWKIWARENLPRPSAAWQKPSVTVSPPAPFPPPRIPPKPSIRRKSAMFRSPSIRRPTPASARWPYPGGNVEGIKGSTLRIDALSTKEIVKAEIVMEDGKQLPLKIDGKKLQGNLVLFQSQQYRILVQDAQGFRNSPIAYELKVKPDGFPTIDLLRPTEDLEVNGDEVLALEYSARDDFGISEVNLVAKVGDREDKIRLAKG